VGAGCVLPPTSMLDYWSPVPSRLGAGHVGLSGSWRGGEGQRPEGRGHELGVRSVGATRRGVDGGSMWRGR